MKRILMAGALLLALLFSFNNAHAQLADSPWPMYHGGPQHGGRSTYDTSHVDGTVKWIFETGTRIESSPVIGEDGTIYIGSHNNTFYAFNPDGTVKWQYEPSTRNGFASSPAISKDGTIYVGSQSGGLYAFGGPSEEESGEESKKEGRPTIYYLLGGLAIIVVVVGGIITYKRIA